MYIVVYAIPKWSKLVIIIALICTVVFATLCLILGVIYYSRCHINRSIPRLLIVMGICGIYVCIYSCIFSCISHCCMQNEDENISCCENKCCNCVGFFFDLVNLLALMMLIVTSGLLATACLVTLIPNDMHEEIHECLPNDSDCCNSVVFYFSCAIGILLLIIVIIVMLILCYHYCCKSSDSNDGNVNNVNNVDITAPPVDINVVALETVNA